MRRIAAALLLACVLAGCSEQRAERFATGADALGSDAARRGWIPPWLPPGARNVLLQYNLDTNETWIRFDLPRADAVVLQRRLRPLRYEDILDVELRRPRGMEWPQGVIEQQPENDGALYAHIFAGDGRVIPRDVTVAFEKDSTRVFVWIR